MHCFVLRKKNKNKRERKTLVDGRPFFFFFNWTEIKIEDSFCSCGHLRQKHRPSWEFYALLLLSFLFPLLSNKATFRIKYIGCLIAAKRMSHCVGPKQGLCSLCIIRRDIERHPLSLGSIHQLPPTALSVAVKCIFNRLNLSPQPPTHTPTPLSGYSYCDFWVKAGLRCFTTFSTVLKKKKEKKTEKSRTKNTANPMLENRPPW